MTDRFPGLVDSALFPISIFALVGAAPALAQENPPPPASNRDTVTIGVGAGIVPSYDGSDDYVFTAAPVARGSVSGFRFFFRGGPAMFVDLVREESGNTLDIAAGPVLGVRLDRTSRIKDEQVRALGKLDTAIELGGFVGIGKTGVLTSPYDNLSFRVSYQRDVANAHDSYVITPAIEYGTPLSMKTFVGIAASANYVGGKYARYYFDVTPGGSLASGLDPYQTDDGGFKNVSFTLFAAHALSDSLLSGTTVFAGANYSRLLGKFADSPIVADAGSPNQFMGFVGIGYTF